MTRTELIWPGKYDPSGARIEPPRVQLPFQVIERVNESRATREAESVNGWNLFDVWHGEAGSSSKEGWRNKLIWGENAIVVSSLAEMFAGRVDLIYVDPPFATGADFTFRAQIGGDGADVEKEQSIIEEKAYRDTWGAGIDSYMKMMYDRISLMYDLLSPRGSLFVHCDWHVDFLLRALLDERFGAAGFRNEIIWYYYNKFQGNVNRFASNHDVLLWYTKSQEFTFNQLKEKRAEGTVKQIRRKWDKEAGRIVNVKGADGRVVYQETDEKTVDDVWRIPMLQPADKTQNLGYPTQKPEALLSRVIEAASEKGDLIADFFCGSGTTLAVAEKLGRRWIGCDLGRFAIHTSRKRLLSTPHCKPFELLNLGKYERQYWQVTSFDSKEGKHVERTIYEYLTFVLKLYGAEPVTGLSYLHGRKGKALVRVGMVDAPVTIDDLAIAIKECKELRQKELHVLGWEWEMGLNDLMAEQAELHGVRLLLLQIPRELMDRQSRNVGDVTFFELAHVEAKLEPLKGLRLKVTLSDFTIPNAELIPDEIRKSIRKWSDYVDYWSVDWNFAGDTFMQGWVTYRTRNDRALDLKTEPHTYEKPGTYRALVKVVDIFGNDTTRAYDVDVKS